MSPGKRARAGRTIGPFRALNAVNTAVDACAGFSPGNGWWWEMIPWKKNTAERVLAVGIEHSIGYYGGEDPIHAVCRLARLTACVLLARMLRANGSLSWRAVSVAVDAVKKVFNAYYTHVEFR